jgi:hypothetical protein
MTKPAFRPLSLGTLAASALACVPLSGVSADTYDDWQYSATLYLWAAGIQAETPGGAEADVDFSTLISNLSMAFMGGFEARKDRWALAADFIYLNVGANDNGTVPVRVASGAAADLDVAASVETKGRVFSLLGAYNLQDDEKARVDAFVGTRYLDLELEFSLSLADPGQFNVARDYAPSQTSWDAIVGVKGRLNLDGPWHLPYYLDVGTGQSDFTWQAAGGVGYSFGQGDVSLLYRYAAWELGSGESLEDISFSGPMLAGTWRF